MVLWPATEQKALGQEMRNILEKSLIFSSKYISSQNKGINAAVIRKRSHTQCMAVTGPSLQAVLSNLRHFYSNILPKCGFLKYMQTRLLLPVALHLFPRDKNTFKQHIQLLVCGVLRSLLIRLYLYRVSFGA